MPKESTIPNRWLIFLSILIIAVNLVVITPRLGSFALGVIRSWQQDGLWRSGKFAFSANFSNYIDFLRAEIPPDALVVIPPEEVSSYALADTPTMQFFLAPRRIHNCRDIACAQGFIGQPGTYILIMGLNRFPGPEIAGGPENIRMHNDTWGVYGPAGSFGQAEDENRWRSVGWLRSAVLPLVGIILLLGMGCLLGAWLRVDLRLGPRLAVGTGLLLGIYSLAAYLLLLVGAAARLGSLLAAITVVLILILAWGLWKGRISWKNPSGFLKDGRRMDLWTLAFLAVGVGLGFLAVGTGFHETDSIVLWGAKAQGLISEGLPGMASWGTNTTYYPLHLPLLLGMTLDAFGLGLPAAKLIYPLYHWLLVLLVFNYLQPKMGSHLAGFSALALASMPLIARHGMIAYANLPLTFYLVSGLMLFHDLEDRTEDKPAWLLSGLCFALAVWTRPEGIWLVLGTCGVILLQQLILLGWGGLLPASLALVPPVALEIIWILSRGVFYSGVEGMGGSLELVLGAFRQGTFHLKELALIAGELLKALTDIHSWGAAAVVLICGLLLAVSRRAKIDAQAAGFLAAGLMVLVLVSLMYYAFSFTEAHDLSWWINTGYDRMIMPGAILIWLGGVLTVSSKATAQAG